MNILPALKTHLTNGGISTTIKLNTLPDSPKNIVMIRDTGEITPDTNDTASTEIENRTFQIWVRGDVYTDTEAVCDAIRDLLHNHKMTVGGIKFLNVEAISGFQPITNEVGNYEFSGNFSTRALKL